LYITPKGVIFIGQKDKGDVHPKKKACSTNPGKVVPQALKPSPHG
jgi:hypothetical protein